MTAAHSDDWRDVFCGREVELRQLITAYEAVAAGGGPRLAVVCADRGMGKTRLVQELYRHLSSAHDPGDYWPDASLFKGNNLRVAPDFNDPPTQAHFASFTTAERPMPFLWWGFRLPDPLDRNAVRSDMAAHRRTLDPHLERARFAREHAARHAAVRHAAKNAAKDAALKIGEALLDSVPGVGLGKNLIEVGAGLFKTARAHRDAQRERQAFDSADLAALDARRVDDLYERTLQDLAAVLQPDDELGRVPAIVFCDDAQFARDGGDEGALRFLQQLWQRAEEEGWPLLLLATHWAVDWEQDAKASAPSFAKAFAPVAQRASAATVVMLSKRAELVGLVCAALPGMPLADTRLLVDKADGNPQVLIELIARVRASPAWRTRQGALSPHGRKQIEVHSCNLTTLITERLLGDTTPPEVRVALALASVQGMQFLAGLTEAAARQLSLGEAGGGLVVAENPLRLVVGVRDGVASFVQRAYREAAATLVESQLGDPAEIRGAVLDAAARFIEPGDEWEHLPAHHKKSLLGIVGSLGAEADSEPTRLQAARALLRLLEVDVDIASRAQHARVLVEGMGSRWSATKFEPCEIDAIAKALLEWGGLLAGQSLYERCVQELRPAAAADAQSHVGRLVHVLLKLASDLDWQDQHDEAGALVDEAIELGRRLPGRDGTGACAELAQILHDASMVFWLRDPRPEVVALWSAEELSLRRTHFEAAFDPPAAEALVSALNRQALGCEADQARALREEALDVARRLVARAPGDRAAGRVLVRALVGCLSSIITIGDVEFRLPSADEAAAALPMIEEVLNLGLPLDANADHSNFEEMLSIIGAAAANRCGDTATKERLLLRSRSAGDCDAASLSPEDRAQRWYLLSIRALLEADEQEATALARAAVRDATEARDWHRVESALAFAHRLRERHLLLLVEPDPSLEDRAVVWPEVVRAVCADAPAWRGDLAGAGAAFDAIAGLMKDAVGYYGLGEEVIARSVHEVRQAFALHGPRGDRASRPSEVAHAWLLATARTLVLATRAGQDDDFDSLWQLLRELYEAGSGRRPVDELAAELDALRALYFVIDGVRSDVLGHAIVPVVRLLAERTGDPIYRRHHAFHLCMCACERMRDDDLDEAAALLDEAHALCIALLAEAVSPDNLNEMRRALEAREILARRRGDAVAEREVQLERAATLRRLVCVDDCAERRQELEELAAVLASGKNCVPAVH